MMVSSVRKACQGFLKQPARQNSGVVKANGGASHLQSQFSEMAALAFLVLLEDHFLHVGFTYLKYLCLLLCSSCCFAGEKICSIFCVRTQPNYLLSTYIKLVYLKKYIVIPKQINMQIVFSILDPTLYFNYIQGRLISSVYQEC